MFKVKLDDGREFTFRFRHNRPLLGLSGYTSCHVFDDDLQRMGYGLARCSPKDQFCKETGRKISLTQALRTLPLTKAQRRQVWQSYFARKGNAKAVTFSVPVIGYLDSKTRLPGAGDES